MISEIQPDVMQTQEPTNPETNGLALKKRKWQENSQTAPFAKKIRLDVGGTLYTTSWETLAGPCRERTMLSAMFSGMYKIEEDNGTI